MVAHWPASLPSEGRFDRETVAGVTDIYATILVVAGGEDDCDGGYCGENLLPYLREQRLQTAKTLFWEHAGWRAVRDGRWKAVFDAQGAREWMLFDILADPGERRDLATQHPAVVADLGRRWQAWADEVGVDDRALGALVDGYRRHFAPQSPQPSR